MRKKVFFLLIACVFAIISKAESSISKPTYGKSNMKEQKSHSPESINSYLSSLLEKKPATCFEVTFYLSCGYHWAGDYCVAGNSAVLTQEQFVVGWNFKNRQLCGSTAPWVP